MTIVDRQCKAMSKRSRERCRRAASPGAAVCATHGAKSPQARRAAGRRLAEAKAAKSLARLGVASIDDPAAELLAVAEESRALSKWLASYVAALQHDPAGADPVELRARLDALSKQQERTARMLGEITKLGLAEQRLALDAQRIQIVAELLERIVTALGLDPADPGVRLIIGREIRALPQVVEGQVIDRG